MLVLSNMVLDIESFAGNPGDLRVHISTVGDPLFSSFLNVHISGVQRGTFETKQITILFLALRLLASKIINFVLSIKGFLSISQLDHNALPL